MSERQHSTDLVEKLLEYAGIDTDGFAETGKALISIDAETTILVGVDAEVVHLIAPLGTTPPSEGFATALLKESFKSIAGEGYGYAIDPKTSDLVVSRTLQARRTSSVEFERALITMAEHAKRWSRSLNAGSTDVVTPTESVASTQSAADAAPHHLRV